MNKEEDRW